MQPSEEIKGKLDIVEFIREYIPVKAAGINFRANCPFHHEKTPSFMISPEKQIWHCFGCGKGGDVFSFLMEMEGIDFVEALRILAPKAGVTLTKQDPRTTSQRNKLLDILDLSRRFYHKVLLDTPQAEMARKYLAERGLSDDTIEEWQIGYSRDSWDDLINFLKSKGFNDKEIFLSGMSVQKNDQNRYYNRFRNRIMFPINDINANTVGFTARVSPEREAQEKMGKYINSPQSMIYDKSKIIFGLDKAKMDIKNKDVAVVVEGQMDVITAHQNGFRNVVASSGTALTSDQVATLKRYSSNIALAFDMDKAGQMAADRGIREAMAKEMNIRVVELPEGKDPDECIKKNPEVWEKSVSGAKQVMQYFFDKVLKKLDLTNIEHKRKATIELLPTIGKLANKIEQDFWLKKLSQAIDVDENLLRETLKKSFEKQATPKNANLDKDKKREEIDESKKTREEKISELLLALVIKFSFLVEYSANHMEVGHLTHEGLKTLYRNLIFYYNNIINSSSQKGDQNKPVEYNKFKDWLLNESNNQDNNLRLDQLKILDKLVLLGDKEFYELNDEMAKEEALRMMIYLKKHDLSRRKKEIEKLVYLAEKKLAHQKKEEQEETVRETYGLIEELKMLSDELNELNG